MEEVIFRLKGYNGEYFCLKGWLLSMGCSADGGISIEANLYQKTGVYQINGGKLFLSTYLLENFLADIQTCYKTLSGQASYKADYDEELIFQILMERGGNLILLGTYQEHLTTFSSLRFEMASDQTFLATAIRDLETFLSHISD